MTRLAIRPAETPDYPGISRVHNAVHPDNPFTPEELARLDAAAQPPYRFARFLAEDEDGVKGTAVLSQNPGTFDPRRFHVDVDVQPADRGRGVGSALFTELRRHLARARANHLLARVDGHDAASMAFALRRGFTEVTRDIESVLDLAAFDEVSWAWSIERVREQGITLRSFADLASAPDALVRYHELFTDVRRDVPRSAPATPVPLDVFERVVVGAPDFDPEGHLIAVHGDALVGMTQLWRGEATRDLFTGLTGVRPGYRRRGLALALKVEAAKRGRAVGAARIHTDNDTRNAGMLALNERLGFRPAKVSVTLEWRAAAPAA